MSDSEKVEADSTGAQEVKEETKKGEDAPAPANGDSSNGLSTQLEEKIIRQVEVTSWCHGIGPRGESYCSFILVTGIFPETSFSNQHVQRMREDVSCCVHEWGQLQGTPLALRPLQLALHFWWKSGGFQQQSPQPNQL